MLSHIRMITWFLIAIMFGVISGNSQLAMIVGSVTALALTAALAFGHGKICTILFFVYLGITFALTLMGHEVGHWLCNGLIGAAGAQIIYRIMGGKIGQTDRELPPQ